MCCSTTHLFYSLEGDIIEEKNTKKNNNLYWSLLLGGNI